MSERVNFAERVRFANEIGQLQVENEHLRESVRNAEHEESVAWGMVRSAERRNDKLRELVRDMWNGMCGYAHDCRSCEHFELYEGQRLVGKCQFHARMRELGVEV